MACALSESEARFVNAPLSLEERNLIGIVCPVDGATTTGSDEWYSLLSGMRGEPRRPAEEKPVCDGNNGARIRHAKAEQDLFNTLAILSEHQNGLTVSELAPIANASTQTIRNRLRKLEDSGYVQNVYSEQREGPLWVAI